MMLCRKPIAMNGAAYACGKCMPCRFNKRRTWTHRLMLESLCHKDNTFLTLTYSDLHLPDGGTLVPDHLQDWLKRLRWRLEPDHFRFFGVGEYGDKSDRPHYHVALFNVKGCEHGVTRYKDDSSRCCSRCMLFTHTWTHGNVFAGKLELHSAQYIAGYVTKKMTAPDDSRLNGRYPEFMRSSRRPGIGVPAMWDVASTMMQHGLDDMMVDVPSAVRMGGKMLPYGRTLTRKLREMIGRDPNMPQEKLDEIQAKMLPLREAAKRSKSHPALTQQIVKAGDGKVAQIDARNLIFKKERKI